MLKVLGGGVAAVGLAGGYMRFLEPRWLRVSRLQVPLSPGQSRRPLKLLHLSDLHVCSASSLALAERAIEAGLRWRPELICVTGDFITRHCELVDTYSRLLGRLAQAAPAFATLGNHDGGNWAGAVGGYPDTQAVRSLLTRGGLTLLHNERRQLAVQEWKIGVVGLGDIWAGEFNAKRAFAASGAADSVEVVLSHNPDSKEDLAQHRWNLLLCGHTHGGQLELPLIGTPFAPVDDRRYVSGLYRWEARWIHITRGVGNVFGVRFNCRPEISLLTLT